QPAGADGFAEDVSSMQSPPTAVVAVASLDSGAAFQTVGLDEATGKQVGSALFNPAPANNSDVPWFARATGDGWVIIAGLLGQEVDPTTGATNDIDAEVFAYQVTTVAAAVPESTSFGVPALVLTGASTMAAAVRTRRL